MFKNPIRKNLVSIVIVTLLLAVTGFEAFSQCGVYFKRAKTWSFPVSRIHLDSVGDMTGDGLPDLVVGEQGTAGLFTRARYIVLPNLGNGNFGPPWATIEPSAGVVFNDYHSVVNVNGDNKMDLMIMLTSSSLPNTFKTFINNGNGTFTEGPTNSLGTSRTIFDLNDDGLGDYIPSGSVALRYHPGNGDGTFGAAVTIMDHGGSPGDYNGDHKTDFVDGSHLHLNNGDGTWGTIDISTVLAGSGPSGLADFNMDGKLDLFTSNSNGVPGFGILISTGTGFTRTNFPLTVDPSLNGGAWIWNWGGDAAPDIVLQPQNLNKKVVIINDGTGNFPTQVVNEGRLDTITGQKTVYADFDNDGKIDRIQAASNITNTSIMLRDITSFTFEKDVCDQQGQARIVDYDRSNSTDWSFWNPTTGDWSRRTIANRTGPPVSNETINWGLGSLGDIPTPGDFDGDGITDRAVFRNTDGYWYIRRSSDAVWFVMRFGLPGDKPVVADYDGDTISDIAVWRPSDGNWYIWYMGTQSFYAQHFGSDGDKPVPADFDGDFKTDLAVYRPSTGVWYYYKSTDGNWVAYAWGVDTDRPIPADFDGDGKADITVHRPSDNVAYILRSSTSIPSYYQFGVAGDILQVGDYDGDYVADLGVYRPSNNTWWTTTFLFSFQQNYGAPGVIPTSSTIRAN